MPSDAGADTFQPTLRVHRWSWLFLVWAMLKNAVWGLVPLVFFGTQTDFSLWLLIPLAVVAGVAALWQQWTYRYGFGPRGLVIHEGLFFRKHRRIDYRRIENIDTERGLLHRLLGVAKVRVETSSGGKPEAAIQVLDMEAVAQMRQRIFAQDRSGPSAASTETATDDGTLLHLGPGELARLGLIDNRGLLVIAAALGAIAQAGALDYGLEYAQKHWGKSDLVQAILAPLEVSLLDQVLYVLFAVVFAFVATRILSITYAFLRYYGFHLQRLHQTDGGTVLRASYGLLTRVNVSLRQRRIQSVHQKATLLHRCFKRVALQVETAGGGQGASAEAGQQQFQRELWLAPVCPAGAAPGLIEEALPQMGAQTLSTAEWQPLAAGAQGRLFRRALWLGLLLVVLPAAIWLHFHALWLLFAVLALAWLHARLYVRYTAWAIHDEVLLYKHGWLTRRLSCVPVDRIQTVVLRHSPLDRHFGMAGVYADTAGAGKWGNRVDIRLLDAEVAQALAQRLNRQTGYRRGAPFARSRPENDRLSS